MQNRWREGKMEAGRPDRETPAVFQTRDGAWARVREGCRAQELGKLPWGTGK